MPSPNRLDLAEQSFRRCVIGPISVEAPRREIVELGDPILSELANLEGRHMLVGQLSSALRAYGAAAISAACVRSDAQTALDALLAAHRRGMESHEGYHDSDSDALIAARAALWQATDGRDETLFAHLRGYSQARPMFEALRGTCAAAEEWTVAGSAAERVWPLVIDTILDAADANPELIRDRYWDKHVLSGLMPNPTYKQMLLTMEQRDASRPWRNLLAWRSQVERWLGYAAGDRQSIDSLVIAIRELPLRAQLEIGLPWVEQMLKSGGDGCAHTFTLPEWLRERQADAATPTQKGNWQRVVDLLVVAGDSRMADLAD